MNPNVGRRDSCMSHLLCGVLPSLKLAELGKEARLLVTAVWLHCAWDARVRLLLFHPKAGCSVLRGLRCESLGRCWYGTLHSDLPGGGKMVQVQRALAAACHKGASCWKGKWTKWMDCALVTKQSKSSGTCLEAARAPPRSNLRLSTVLSAVGH